MFYYTAEYLKYLIDDEKCYDTIHQIHWPNDVFYPHCQSDVIIKQVKDEKQKAFLMGSRLNHILQKTAVQKII